MFDQLYLYSEYIIFAGVIAVEREVYMTSTLWTTFMLEQCFLYVAICNFFSVFYVKIYKDVIMHKYLIYCLSPELHT